MSRLAKGQPCVENMLQPKAMGIDKATAQFRVHDLLVDTARARVTRAGNEVPLPKLSFDFLWVLIECAPAIATTDELIARVWPGLVISPETVGQRAKLLREALGDNSKQPRYIAVARGRGYRLVADVERLDATSSIAAAAKEEQSMLTTGRSGRSEPRRRVVLASGIALAVTALLFLAYQRVIFKPPASAPAVIASIPGTVAVLPFANLTGDSGKEYLGDGMADELINTLNKVPGLQVPARTSSFAYKGRSIDIRQIAKDLGVSAILEGSVRTAGERIRITAQLVNAQNGLHIWSQSYDREFTDLFKLQDDLASAIVQALRPNFGLQAANTPVLTITHAPPTSDVEAYNLFLQGASLSRRQNLDRAVEYFQQALALDPKFARAYQGIADAKFISGWIYGQRVYENVIAGERAAQQALALDPNLADAHNVLGGVAAVRGRWLEMESHDRAALSLGPDDAQVHLVRADHLATVGRLQAAFAEAQTAYSLAPVDPQVVIKLAAAYSVTGRDADALKYAEIAVDLGALKNGTSDMNAVRVRAALHDSHYAEAAEQELKALDMTDSEQARTAEVVKRVYAALVDPRQKMAAIAARLHLYPRSKAQKDSGLQTDIAPCMHSSVMYALLGTLDVAYDLANQCLDRAAPEAILATAYVSTFKWGPELRAFRQDPRFQAFVTRLGLMEYYQQYGPPDDCDLKDGKLTCH